mgnify:FL=1
MKIKDHEYEYERLAIGGTLPAFLFCYYNSVPNINVELKKPFVFDETNVLHKDFGDTKREVLEKLGTTLSLGGLLPFAGTTKSIRIIDENTLEAYSEARKVKVKFGELIVFDEIGIQNLPKVTKRVKKKYKVYDWLFAKQGKKHEHRLLETDDDFVKKVIFHPSFKRGASSEWYDPVAISHMTEKQLHDVNYGENLVRLKVTAMMKEAGIRGAANGYDTRKPDRRLYYAVKVEHTQREVETIGRDVHKDTKTIKFNHQTEEEIEKNFLDTYAKRVYNKIC